MVTPDLEDTDRLTENILLRFRDEIKTTGDFDKFYDKYMTRDGRRDLTTEQDVFMRREVKGKVSTILNIPLRRAKPLPPVKKRKIRKPLPTAVQPKQLKTPARVRKQIVLTRKEFIKVRGKKVVRHRDRRGRFASVKKKSSTKG